jgi:hypothetical protein
VRKPVACVSAVQASSHLTSGKKLSGALLRARRSQISRGSTTFTPQASGACRPRYCSAFVIASPDRERATGADLLQQSGADQLIDNLSGGFPFKVRGSSAPRSSRCEAADRMMSCVSVSLGIGILHCVGAASFAATTTAPPWPFSRRGRIPRCYSRPERSHYRSVRMRMPVLSG